MRATSFAIYLWRANNPLMATHEFLLIASLGIIAGTVLGALFPTIPITVFVAGLAMLAFVSTAFPHARGVSVAGVAMVFLLLCSISFIRTTRYAPPEPSDRAFFSAASERTTAILQHTLVNPSYALIDGILTGHDDALPYDIKQQFNITGTRHITAVSGMNITILANVFLALLIAIGLRRTHAMPATLFAIIWYVLMIGAPASAVRAGIMGSLLVIKQLFGRPGSSRRLLIYAVAGMLMMRPDLLVSDIGFQLSVGATAGIILLQPILQRWLRMVPEFAALRSSISTTLAAYAFTIPFISYYFGTISVSAVPANVLIGPAVTWIFVSGGVGVLIAMLIPVLAYIALSPAHFVSTYVLSVVDILSRVPYASIAWHMTTLWWSIPYYALLLLFIHKNSTNDRYIRVKSES